MNSLLHFDGLERTVLPGRPVHLAIGMFDGLHLGHQSVIAAAVSAARQGGGLAGVLTFWPHPSALFRPENPTRLLMPPVMKRQVLAGLGLDFVIEQNFTRDFARIEASEFIPWLQQALPQLQAIYVGENWRYGRGRLGDVAGLTAAAAGAGLKVFSAPRLNHQGTPISSSRIRELLAAGAIEEVNALLGYAYFAEGVVEHGRELGRTLGFPTLNVPWQPELSPRFGVYAVTVEADGQPPFPGVANYGVRPSVGQDGKPLLEVHLLASSALTYGAEIKVNWLHFIRPEAKFGSLDALRQQIAADVETARKFHRLRAAE